MDSQNVKKFPFEFRPFQPEEAAELNKHFDVCFKFNRVGPKGYILSADYEDDAENIYNMPLKPDDIIVYSFPRSGTTWVQELVWLISSNLDYKTARAIPLSQRFSFLEHHSLFNTRAVAKIMEFNKSKGIHADAEYLKQLTKPGSELVANCPSPRFIKTHLPLSTLPPATLDTAKVVYIARDPRDAAVSFYHLNKQAKYLDFNGDFKTFWDLFTKNLILWTPYFENLKEAWALKHHPNMLFLFYEELSKDYSATVRRVADFFGKNLSAIQVADLCDHLSFDNFRTNDSVNISELVRVGVFDSDGSFIRKGQPGGWREYLDEEMTQDAERWIAHSLRDTDFRFPHLRVTGGRRKYLDEEMTQDAERWIAHSLRDTDFRFLHLNY